MRHIVIDTETTGFTKNRLIEVAALEFDPLTGEVGASFHTYVRPDSERVESGALKVHGLSTAFLSDKPLFSAVAPAFKKFLDNAVIYAHNASFDTRVLNAELSRVGFPELSVFTSDIRCTLNKAKSLKLPTVNSKLDTLCDYFGVDRSSRKFHGALLDCQLTVAVYQKLLLVPSPVDVPKSASPATKARSTPDPSKRPGWRPGGPWYDDEKESLANLYTSNVSFDDICLKHNRSFVSIVMQLVKQGIISQEKCDELRAERDAKQNLMAPSV